MLIFIINKLNYLVNLKYLDVFYTEIKRHHRMGIVANTYMSYQY